MMYYALLSMTLFPDGVTLLFLVKGHSHMLPDRVTSWLRQSIKKMNLYSPPEVVERFNSVKSVTAEYIDYRSPDAPMHQGWDNLLQGHFREIPYLKDIGGYTSCHLFEFHKGVLRISKSGGMPVYYEHNYVASRDGSSGEEAVTQCKNSIEQILFKNDKTFNNATMEDIRLKTTG